MSTAPDPEIHWRPTVVEVDVAAFMRNVDAVRGMLPPGSRLIAVLKADGYGHGAPAVARTLERAGAPGFCVALLEEAIELREAGIRTPILVMGGYHAGAYEEIAQHGVVPVVYETGQLEGLARAARILGHEVEAHVKIDTGMSRLGVRMQDLERFAATLATHPQIRVTGLMTHLACADGDGGFTEAQMARFEEATRRLAQLGVAPPIRHVANSAALLRGEAILDAVRPGLAIFGVAPRRGGEALSSDLRPVMRVRTEVVDMRTIDIGESVGYGALFRAKRSTRIATVPIGYADGLSRQLSNRGHVLVRGTRAPIVGAVSMDMSMIDVTDVPGAALRDEVVVLGSQEGPLGKDTITADEVAAHAGTIAWEVLTSISRRVPRFYREP